MVQLIVRFVDSGLGKNVADFPIPDHSDITYAKLKKLIREHDVYCADKRLKLIYNGRVLNEHSDFSKDIVSKYSDPEAVAYIHCVIGEHLSAKLLKQENELDNKTVETTTNPEVIGFDRLLQQGFSQDDVNELRAQFEQIYNVSRVTSQINDLEEEENRQNYLHQLEERWINSTVTPANSGIAPPPPPPTAVNEDADPVNAPVPAETEETRNDDMLVGLLIGVFLGSLGILFLLIDSSVFNKRQRMAIGAGVFLNFSMALVSGQWI